MNLDPPSVAKDLRIRKLNAINRKTKLIAPVVKDQICARTGSPVGIWLSESSADALLLSIDPVPSTDMSCLLNNAQHWIVKSYCVN